MAEATMPVSTAARWAHQARPVVLPGAAVQLGRLALAAAPEKLPLGAAARPDRALAAAAAVARPVRLLGAAAALARPDRALVVVVRVAKPGAVLLVAEPLEVKRARVAPEPAAWAARKRAAQERAVPQAKRQVTAELAQVEPLVPMLARRARQPEHRVPMPARPVRPLAQAEAAWLSRVTPSSAP